MTVSAPGYAAAEATVTVERAYVPWTACACQQCAAWTPTSVDLAAQ